MGTATGRIADRDAVRRLLQRVGLGPRPGELDAAVARGFDATVSALTQPASGPDAGQDRQHRNPASATPRAGGADPPVAAVVAGSDGLGGRAVPGADDVVL